MEKNILGSINNKTIKQIFFLALENLKKDKYKKEINYWLNIFPKIKSFNKK